jgi:pilus assembly protein CpaE
MTDPQAAQNRTRVAQGLAVLIVDEDPDGRVAARKAVQRAQFNVAGETGFGIQAISLALQMRPDAVLISVEEPVGRALETAEGIASSLPDTPIVIYSSIDDAASMRRAMLFGARDYLAKPLQSAQLRAAVLRALEREERRQMRRAGQVSYRGRGTVISVTGAKGGVGKTVVAVNLALALRLQTGKSIAILDADTQFGDVATMLDLSPAKTSGDMLQALERVDRETFREYMTTDTTGLDVLAAHTDGDAWGSATREQLSKVVELLASVYEFVVIDTAGSFDAFVRACVEASTLTLVVTSGEVSSVRDTAAAMRRLDSWGLDRDRIRLVLNRQRKGPGIQAPEVAKAVGRDVFWDIPFDGAVPNSVQLGRPVTSFLAGSPLAKSMTLLARKIAGTNRALVAPPARDNKQPFWNRLWQFKGNKNDAVAAAPEASDSQR